MAMSESRYREIVRELTGADERDEAIAAKAETIALLKHSVALLEETVRNQAETIAILKRQVKTCTESLDQAIATLKGSANVGSH